jgi:outer membrane protein TolC
LGHASLRDVLARSVPADPQVRSAAAAQAVAQERLRQSRSRLLPALGLGATAGDGHDEEFGRKVGRRLDRSELLLRWNLYNGGADAAEVSATELEWVAATEDLNQAQDLVAERICSAYLDAWRWQSLLEPSLARVKSVEQWVVQARTQVRAGRLSDADLQQAEYSLTDAQLSHQVLAAEAAGALAALNVLVGEPVAGVLPQTLPRLSVEEARGLTPAGVRVARLRAAAADRRVVSAAQLAAPRVDLDARKRLSDNTRPAQTTTSLDSWSVGMRWEFPLGGETYFRRKELVARADGAKAEAARVEQGLVAELASLGPKLASGEQALMQLQRQAEQYDAMVRAGRVQFDAGRRTLQQLIQLEDGRIGVVQRLAEQSNRLEKLRLRMLVLAGRLSGSMGLGSEPQGTRRASR